MTFIGVIPDSMLTPSPARSVNNASPCLPNETSWMSLDDEKEIPEVEKEKLDDEKEDRKGILFRISAFLAKK